MNATAQPGSAPLRIGGLADAAGVGIETIRYYERRGLLGRPQKPYGGQRLYPPTYVQRVRFIKRAQALGFSLEEITALLALDGGTGHARARQIATQRLAQIEVRMADLGAMRSALIELIDHCAHSEGRVSCPIITTLAAAPPADLAGPVGGKAPGGGPGAARRAAPARTRG
jgi:MerR family mercuric resistance operon transcriptional regulator